jgi:hypothetical protein
MPVAQLQAVPVRDRTIDSMRRRQDSTGQVIIEFLAFMATMMAAMAAFMDDLMEVIEGLLP